MSRRKQTKPRHIETESEIASLIQNGKFIDKKGIHTRKDGIHNLFQMTGDRSDYISSRFLREV